MIHKYYAKISYPDITSPQYPEIIAIFALYEETQRAAIHKAKEWGVAIVRQMMRKNSISPYEADLAAPELVKVLKVDLWKEQQ